jgi:hypothetical protein
MHGRKFFPIGGNLHKPLIHNDLRLLSQFGCYANYARVHNRVKREKPARPPGNSPTPTVAHVSIRMMRKVVVLLLGPPMLSAKTAGLWRA